jgi:hypothetical protein
LLGSSKIIERFAVELIYEDSGCAEWVKKIRV